MLKPLIGFLLFFISYQAFAAAAHFGPIASLTPKSFEKCGPFGASAQDAEEAARRFQALGGEANADVRAVMDAEVTMMETQYCSDSPDFNKEKYCKVKSNYLVLLLDETVASQQPVSPVASQMDDLRSFCDSN